jgi:hypothetical protein
MILLLSQISNDNLPNPMLPTITDKQVNFSEEPAEIAHPLPVAVFDFPWFSFPVF